MAWEILIDVKEKVRLPEWFKGAVCKTVFHWFESNTELQKGRYQSGQMGRTVNPLSYDFGGSNPPLPTE